MELESLGRKDAGPRGLHTQTYIRIFALDWEKAVDIFLIQCSCFFDEETVMQGDPVGSMKQEWSLSLLNSQFVWVNSNISYDKPR